MSHRCSYCGKAGHKRPTCRAAKESPLAGTIPSLSVETRDIMAKRFEIEIPEKPPAPIAKRARAKTRKIMTTWELTEEVMPHCSRVLLYGPPGTGKTTAANFSGSPDPELVFNVTLTEEMPAAELRGHYVPRGGEFVWNDGPAMSAYRKGGRLVLNEIDCGSSDALIFCYALLDDPGISRITLPTGESVRPHENFTVVATTNGDPDDLPAALADRFEVRILIDKPHPDAMKTLPDDLQDPAGNSVSGTGESRVSFRAWRNFANLRDKVGEDMAARAVFGTRATTILDTLKLTRTETYTAVEAGDPESHDYPSISAETIAIAEGRHSLEFKIGDRVRVLPGGYGERYDNWEFEITRISGKHLVGPTPGGSEEGLYLGAEGYFDAEKLELLVPSYSDREDEY